jgi:penicillin-binding protein 1A
MDPQIAYILTRMLRGVVQSGTATRLAKYDLEVVGKTGTTNRYTDAWFVGFTPRYTIATWVGYDKNRSIGRGMTGARAALPIWESILSRGLEDGWLSKGETFPVPPGVVEVEVEYQTGLRFGPGASRMVKEVFLEGTEPERTYNLQWAQIMQLPWFQQEPFYLPKEGERMPGQVEDWSSIQKGWSKKSR